MSWRQTVQPFSPPSGQSALLRPDMEATKCPPSLVHVLAVNRLMADEATVRDGNCGVHAFVIGLLDLAFRDGDFAKRDDIARLRRCPAGSRLGTVRSLAVSWLGERGSTKLWGGLSLKTWCLAASGLTNWAAYLARMSEDRTWVDTGFLQALACAYQVDVCLFQFGQPHPTVLGYSLLDQIEDTVAACAAVIPIALWNDFHFWGACVIAEQQPDPVDKGDVLIDMLHVDARRGSKRKLQQEEKDDAEDIVAHEGDHTKASLSQERSQPDADRVERELALCSELARWVPWANLTPELLDAVRSVSTLPKLTEDPTPAILARNLAIQSIAYEEHYHDQLPRQLRYHRAARLHLASARVGLRRAVSSRGQALKEYLIARGAVSVQVCQHAVTEPCSRTNAAHACLRSFTAAIVVNWRALWWSLPRTQRKEHLLSSFCRNLRIHREQGLPLTEWQMRYCFMGIYVCRDAFLQLTGLGASSLQDARQGALQGHQSWTSRSELGLAQSICNTNKAKA